jgi:hypothetical protein
MSSRGGETGLSFQQVLFAGYAKVQYTILKLCLSFKFCFINPFRIGDDEV